jgi:hypothetical protein
VSKSKRVKTGERGCHTHIPHIPHIHVVVLFSQLFSRSRNIMSRAEQRSSDCLSVSESEIAFPEERDGKECPACNATILFHSLLSHTGRPLLPLLANCCCLLSHSWSCIRVQQQQQSLSQVLPFRSLFDRPEQTERGMRRMRRNKEQEVEEVSREKRKTRSCPAADCLIRSFLSLTLFQPDL